jgi:hypothetical protein
MSTVGDSLATAPDGTNRTLTVRLEFPRFRGHLSAWPVWVGLEDGVHVRAEALHEAVSGGVSA